MAKLRGSQIELGGEFQEASGGRALQLAAQGNGIAGGEGTALSLATDSTVNFSGAAWTFPADELLVSGTPSTANSVPNKNYIDQQVAQGKVWREALIGPEQLDSANDALSQAGLFYLDNNALGTDFLTITDGSTTRVYTFGVPGGGEVGVTLGADADESMTNLATAISGDGSGLWDAVKVLDLGEVNDGSGTSTQGACVLVYRTDNSAADSYDDRMFADAATPADWQYVNFNGENDYTSKVSANMPSADPAEKQFGIGRATANLVDGETHLTLSGNGQYNWDANGGQWNQVDTGSFSAGDGISIITGVISVVPAGGGSALEFDAGELRVKSGTPGALADTAKAEVERSGETLFVNVDDTSLETTTGIIGVKALGIDTAELAASAVDENKIATSAYGQGLTGGAGTSAKMNMFIQEYTSTGTSFSLTNGAAPSSYNSKAAMIIHLNGKVLTQVAATPDPGEWSISGTTITTGDTLIGGDVLNCMWWI